VPFARSQINKEQKTKNKKTKNKKQKTKNKEQRTKNKEQQITKSTNNQITNKKVYLCKL